MKKSTRFRFSHRSIDALPTPSADHRSSNVEYSDEVEMGLRVAVYKSGRKSFRHRYTYLGKKCAMTIGEYPAVNVEMARERVRENKQMMFKNLDPKEEQNRVQQAANFREFCVDHFLPYAKALRSYKDVFNRVEKRLIPVFGKMALPHVSRRHVASFHQKLRDEVSATTANRYLSQISAIFARAVETGHATENPAVGIPKFKEGGPRTRFLANDELNRFNAALLTKLEEEDQSAQAIFLLLATGQRRNEILSLRWENLDLENGTGFLPNPKGGRARHFPLNSAAVELLTKMRSKRGSSPWVFPSDSKSGHQKDVRRTLKTICQISGVENIRTHDLRRSFASGLANKGVSAMAIRDLLGHQDVRTTQRVYAHLGLGTLRDACEMMAGDLGTAA